MTDRSHVVTDLVLNDSDKSFTVPGNRTYELVSGGGVITTTATAGNRIAGIELLDEAGNVILAVTGSTTVAASQTDAPFGDISTAAASDITIVPVLVPPGGSIRFFDTAAVDAAADDMEVRLQFLVRSA